MVCHSSHELTTSLLLIDTARSDETVAFRYWERWCQENRSVEPFYAVSIDGISVYDRAINLFYESQV